MDHDTRRLDANDPGLPPPQRPCYECGGRLVEARLVTNQNVELQRVSARFGLSPRSLIQTLVCLSCGAVRFYAVQPDKLDPAATR